MLPSRRLAHPSGASAEVYAQGAHVASWVPANGSEALFLSRASRLEPGAAIRGGIPVIFPQFADRGPLPKHGFARTRTWTAVEQPDSASAEWELCDDPETRAIWPYGFRARVRVDLTERALAVELRVRNTGEEPWEFTAALHTYLRVADVRACRIRGLKGPEYLDKVAGERRVEDRPEWSVAGETDRVYFGVPRPVSVRDPGTGRTVITHSEGFADVVVWNPWREGARALPDMDEDEYLHMLCIEAAQIGKPVVLEPGGEWRGSQRLEVVPR